MFGPRYEKTGVGEQLRYTCGCGYTMVTPTRDARPRPSFPSPQPYAVPKFSEPDVKTWCAPYTAKLRLSA